VSSSSEFPAEAAARTDPRPPFTPGRFTGRTAIVTGAGSGIGRATALRLAREGARVVIADIAADRLERLTAEFPDLDLVPVAGDVATEEGTQAVMATAGGGSIVNVSSEASLRASASGVAYTASKHAVNGITKGTAVFYKGDGIRANAVAPGAVATNIEAPFKSEHAAGVLGPIMQTTIPPVATADQLAATITWLLSDDASNVNGTILPSDGGWSAI
jgi:NAD(P)-dependent dehydrogenase (short-subunit alcohol dehydrogenase family)